MSLVFEQVVVMFLLMLAGAGAYRVHLISDEGSRQLTQLLLYLCNPALMISSLALPFDVQLFKQGALAAGVSVIVVLAALISARLMFPGGQGVEQFGVGESGLKGVHQKRATGWRTLSPTPAGSGKSARPVPTGRGTLTTGSVYACLLYTSRMTGARSASFSIR